MTLRFGPGLPETHYWRDLWRYRELFYFLAWRDVLVRYKQTVLGVAWAVLRPVAIVIVFTIVFERVAKLPSGGAPYPLLVLSAMLPWQFFATAFADAGNSLVNNASMLSKVYFPRLILPVSAALAGVVDFLIGLAILLVLMAWFGWAPSLRMLALIPLFALTFLGAAGLGLWISALNIRFRDFRYVVPFVVQIGFFLSPVGFDSVLVANRWRSVYALNPMVGIIDGFRWATLGDGYPLRLDELAEATLVIVLVAALGYRYFRRTERTFADVA